MKVSGNRPTGIGAKSVNGYRFIGTYFARLDHKGRFSFPADFRRIIGKDRLYLVLEGEFKALILPERIWRDKVGKLKESVACGLFSNSFELKIDSVGRTSLNQKVLRCSGFRKNEELVITGEGSFMRVRSAEVWKKEREMLLQGLV